MMNTHRFAAGVALAVLVVRADRSPAAGVKPCRIEVVDKASGWPVPMVELRTTHNVRFVSDNAGLIAFDLPELMRREMWFTVVGHGYEVPKDGFGSRGVRLTPTPGGRLKVEVTRTIIAKRLGRLTGGGLFAESQALGLEKELSESGILGCDSVQNAVHGGKLFWGWGDTAVPHYPLGIFHMSSATTAVRPLASFKPPVRLAFDYFRDDRGRVRGVAQMPGSGPTWLSGYVSLPDKTGKGRLVATYAKIKPPLEAYEVGLCVWNDEKASFERHKVIWTKSADKPKQPPVPDGHWAFRTDDKGGKWVLFGNPLPTLRCPATFEAWEDPDAWAVLKPQEHLTSAADGQPIKPHSGSIAFNDYRKRWVTVFMQWFGKPSAFGELWYAEADAPTGPWGPAVKVLTHENYTFYNPRLHPELTPVGSPILLFEGTYTRMFADRPEATPRFDYNQILYRLDLDDPALKPAHGRAQGPPKAPPLRRVRIGDDKRDFLVEGTKERFTAWGFNYTHNRAGKLIEDFWADDWPTVEGDFREMKALGANTVRVHLQTTKIMTGPRKADPAALKQLGRLVKLAEETRLYLDVTGLACYEKQNVPKWYNRLSEADRWDVQERFWEAVARTCAASDAVFCYDLMNEPILPGKNKETEWLAGEFGGKSFVQRISLDLAGRTRQQVAKAWVAKLVAGIRKHDKRTLVTVGVIPWAYAFYPGAKTPVFYSGGVDGGLDFVSVHFYPKKDDVPKALKALACYDVGKPIVIEETFNLSCGLEDLDAFIDGSRSLADGWIGHYFGRTIEQYEQEQGTIADAIHKSFLEYFRKKTPDIFRSDQSGRPAGEQP